MKPEEYIIGARRDCGECHECCIHLSIDDMKRPHEVCPNLSEGRCATYETRPYECKMFYCLWAQGVLPIEVRPDRNRLIAHMAINRDTNSTGVCVIECEKGALDYERNRSVISCLKEQDTALVKFVRYDGRSGFLFSRDANWIRIFAKNNPTLAKELEGADAVQLNVHDGIDD